MRVRFELDDFPSGNDNTGAFPNFNAINTGAPFDVAGNQFSPQLNVDQNRNRMRLRARFGADLNLGQGFTSGIRVATGQDNSPTSTNQSWARPAARAATSANTPSGSTAPSSNTNWAASPPRTSPCSSGASTTPS